MLRTWLLCHLGILNDVILSMHPINIGTLFHFSNSYYLIIFQTEKQPISLLNLPGRNPFKDTVMYQENLLDLCIHLRNNP